MVIEDLLEVEDDLCVSLLIPRVLLVRNRVQNVVMAKNILTEVLVVLMNIIITIGLLKVLRLDLLPKALLIMVILLPFTFQKESIPSIANAISLEVIE